MSSKPLSKLELIGMQTSIPGLELAIHILQEQLRSLKEGVSRGEIEEPTMPEVVAQSENGTKQKESSTGGRSPNWKLELSRKAKARWAALTPAKRRAIIAKRTKPIAAKTA